MEGLWQEEIYLSILQNNISDVIGTSRTYIHDIIINLGGIVEAKEQKPVHIIYINNVIDWLKGFPLVSDFIKNVEYWFKWFTLVSFTIIQANFLYIILYRLFNTF